MRKLIFVLLLLTVAQAAFAAFDASTGILSNQKWRSGVPLGGLGCGKLEILPDGSLGNYTGNHNWDRPTGKLKGAFAAVFASVGNKKAARMLRLGNKTEYAGVTNIAGIDYAGWFPTATLDYKDAALPMKVQLLAWSPLIPHNAADSALPVACFRFKITNPGKQAGRAVVLMSWPNLVGWGGRRGTEWNDLTGNVETPAESPKISGMLYSKSGAPAEMHPNVQGRYLLCAARKSLQFANASYDAADSSLPFWGSFQANGAVAASDSSATIKEPAAALTAEAKLKPGETRIVDFVLVWNFPNHVTAAKLKKPTGKWSTVTAGTEAAFDGNPATRWSTGHPMLPGEAFSVDMGSVQNLARIVLDSTNSATDYPRGYRLESSLDGASWQLAKVATPAQVEREQSGGLLAISFPPRDARFFRVTETGGESSWFWSIHELEADDAAGSRISTQNWKATALVPGVEEIDAKENVGHYYSNRFKEPVRIAEYALANQNRLLGQTQEWQTLVRKSNLPDWLRLKLINCAFSLYACSVLTRDGRFAVQESPVDMGGATGTMDQRMASHAFYTQMFPELDQAELRLYAECQDLVKPVADGRITHFDGNIHEVIGNPNVGYGVTDWPDLSASWILQVLKLYRWTGDRKFMDDMWPHVKHALKWLKSADRDGDNIPEGGSTYDYEQLPRGAFSYNASCYLGALRAGIHMARIEGDKTAEKTYETQFKATQQSAMATLWNGKYFIKHKVPSTGRENPNSFIAALAGDWLSRISASGPTLSAKTTDAEMREIIARHVKPFYPVPPMEVSPEGRCATSACYIIQHEPYVGCEAIYLGYTDDGLDVIKRVYDCAWTLNQNPWHQSLCYSAPGGGQGGLISYMTCPATWHVLNALSGGTLDVSAKTLYLSPKIGKSLTELHMPVFFSRFWLWLDYVPAKRVLTVKVLKSFGAPVTLDRVAAEGERAPIKLAKAFVAAPGATLNLSSLIGKLVIYPRAKSVSYTVKAYRAPRTGIPSAGWKGDSGLGSEDEGPAGIPSAAWDDNPDSRWTTNRSMRPGDWLKLDMGKAHEVRKIVLDSAASDRDYPRGCTVLLSADGKSWTTALKLSEAECTAKQDKGVLALEFAPTSARYIKLIQTGRTDGLFWSVHEIYVYE